jgi:hypothetical protein
MVTDGGKTFSDDELHQFSGKVQSFSDCLLVSGMSVQSQSHASDVHVFSSLRTNPLLLISHVPGPAEATIFKAGFRYVTATVV